MFTLISSKIGKDTFVKDFVKDFLLLEESYIFGKKIVVGISFEKGLMNIITGRSLLGCPK